VGCVTLPATDTWDVRGHKGPSYTVGPYCSNPQCQRIAEHAHHIVRRSQLSGDYAWVELHGTLVGNLTGLCVPCHEDITGSVGGHRAAIRWSLADSTFQWCDVLANGSTIDYRPVGPIEPQPPTPETLAARAPGPEGSEHCPFCGQQQRRRPAQAAVGRRRSNRKTWAVRVPAEAVEDGANVLDTLVGEIGVLLGVGNDSGARYYTIVPAMTYCLQDGQRFLDAIKGVGG
jgi:hypothetical protein